MLPERFATLPESTWPRLRTLLADVRPGGPEIPMSIGEPMHAFPHWVGDVIAANLDGFARYPNNNGTEELLQAIAGWLGRRYGVTLDHDQLLTLNGTREGLYNAMIALCEGTRGGKQAAVLTPNPFYQVYMVASLSAGAEAVPVNATAETGFLPDYASVGADVLDRTVAAYVCSPANPQGSVADKAYWRALIELAERHDFRIFADECYSEIYRDTPPPGALEVAAEMGADPERVIVFHSLSKRSNLPGLRSGFVAGGRETIAALRKLRAFAGAPLPEPLQAVAARAWSDDTHVAENRALYAEKYRVADDILGDVPGYAGPAAGFFLWLPVDDGEVACRRLWAETGVKTLPGAYLALDTATGNPGAIYIRAAMVAPYDVMAEGLRALKRCLYEVR